MKGQATLFSSASDSWSTPLSLFTPLDQQFHFTLDPCAMPENTLRMPKIYTEEGNGLTKLWFGYTVFCNPPYSDIAAWAKKAAYEACEWGTPIVMLIPARTDTRYWHDYIYPRADTLLFIKGRLKFGNQKNAAPFPSALIGFNLDLTPFESLGYAIKLKP